MIQGSSYLVVDRKRISMRACAQKPEATQENKSATSAMLRRAGSAPGGVVNSILHLQRTIGNRAVQRRLRGQTANVKRESLPTTTTRVGDDFGPKPTDARALAGRRAKLTVNTPGDAYEQEADRIADQVMATQAAVAGESAPDAYVSSGQFNPEQTEGQRLLAHELTHVQQSKGIRPDIQLSRLRDVAGTQHQAFLIGDKDIEATDEFKSYMNSSLVWQWRDKVTSQEAFLACRLIIEAIQRGEPLKWETDARRFMITARKLINITKSPKADCPGPK